MVQEHVLEAIDDANLRVYFVWLPIMLTDNAAAAEDMAAEQKDARAHIYWDPKRQLGDAMGAAMTLPHRPPADDDHANGVAWDIYLLYPPGVTWEDTPPLPDHWQHQLTGLPADNALDGATLTREVTLRIPRAN